ncbi:MAG: lysophospholipid acyltransferase family protein [Phycisphaerales bacterium]
MFVDTRLPDGGIATAAPAPPPAEGPVARLRHYRPGSSLPRILFYELCRYFILSLLTLIYRFRVYGAHRLPRLGPVLVVANHASYLDPPVLGASVRKRQLDYLARSATFKFAPLGKLITLLNAISLKEGEPDTAAIKAVLRRLEEGGAVLIFPEGGRTKSGRMEKLKRGIAVLVKRARCPVVPVGVEGVFDAWPPGQLLPSVIGKRIEVAIGRPIPYEELLAAGPDAALERIGDEIDALRLSLRRRMRRETVGRYPSWGPGDLPRRR